MSWGITETPSGWKWYCANTAYGAATGTASTQAKAVVELYIAEADMFEHPLPPEVRATMRADPERFAADFRHAL